MRAVWRTLAIAALVGFASGAAGVAIGLKLADGAGERFSLDAAVHRELDLTEAQDRALQEIEARHAARRAAIDQEMRAAAREIATIIYEDHGPSERLDRAIERFHGAMGQAQQEAVRHVFEMREVLDERQQARFDDIVRAELLRAAEER
jgi:nickel and cobalt resistance protein CnrR